MTRKNDDQNGFEDMSNKEMLEILLGEIADVRLELKEDIYNLDYKLTNRIDGVEKSLGSRLTSVESKLDQVNLKLDRNTVALMANLEDHEERIAALETVA